MKIINNTLVLIDTTPANYSLGLSAKVHSFFSNAPVKPLMIEVRCLDQIMTRSSYTNILDVGSFKIRTGTYVITNVLSLFDYSSDPSRCPW